MDLVSFNEAIIAMWGAGKRRCVIKASKHQSNTIFATRFRWSVLVRTRQGSGNRSNQRLIEQLVRTNQRLDRIAGSRSWSWPAEKKVRFWRIENNMATMLSILFLLLPFWIPKDDDAGTEFKLSTNAQPCLLNSYPSTLTHQPKPWPLTPNPDHLPLKPHPYNLIYIP